MINDYHFGHIIIDNTEYNHDVIIKDSRVTEWTRNSSHVIDVHDVQASIQENPDTIIIGTGESGIAKVTEQAKKQVHEKNIRLIVVNTPQAVTMFNKSNNAIGLFHITC